MFFPTFIIMTFVLVAIPCLSQTPPSDGILKCKDQKTRHDCIFDCDCGWCEKNGCFDWPHKGRRFHTYRDVFVVCNVTKRQDIQTHYYTNNCKQRRGFFFFMGYALVVLVCLLILIFLSSFFVAVYATSKYFLCELGLGYRQIP